jgi:predicted transposase YbfD/YdcC
LRRSYQKKGAKAPIHMVSAFAARQRLVLGQVKVAEKSNEIVAIPALLAMMAIEGAIVTIDAMGCQREIADQILHQKADYVLALKGNQGTLREDVDVFAAEQKANGFKDTKVSRHETVDGDHGRRRKGLRSVAVGVPDSLLGRMEIVEQTTYNVDAITGSV